MMNRKYPGDTIMETRVEEWNGSVVYEVEIITKDENSCEVILLEKGEFLDAEDE
jgi:uncharacterized membrane protein YkoI